MPPATPGPERSPGSTRRPDMGSPSVPRRRAGGLTTRAALLGLVAIVIVLTLAYPFREFLSQRAEITALEVQEKQAAARVADLTAERDSLLTPTTVERLARERLHMVRPGETAYVVIGGPADDATAPGTPTAAEPQHAWYTQLWQGAVAAGETP